MTGIHQALYSFWSQFSCGGNPIPAYLQGHVPEDAAFPYITFDVASGRAFATSVVAATVWCRAESGINVNAQRAAILDSIDRALPEADIRLDFQGGFAMLRRGSGDFHSYITDEDDKSVVGGVTRCEITAYHE